MNYVSPLHRFSGISQKMLLHLEDVIRKRGFSLAMLTSTETAHRFYKEAGWRDTGQASEWMGMKGYPMQKDL